VRFVGLEVFVFVVELHVTLRQGVMRGVVVLQVVGAQAHRRVLQIHIFIGDEDVAFASLRPVGRKFRVLAFSGGQPHLLGVAGHRRQKQNCRAQREQIAAPGYRHALQSRMSARHAVE